MIVDSHVHAFPPSTIETREMLAEREPTFAELYARPQAKLATAGEVLASMEAAGVDVSIVVGFAWRDPALCRAHNDYLLRAAADSQGRLIAFCALPLDEPDAARCEAGRCIEAGARGFGELRPESQGASLGDANVTAALGWIAEAYRVPLLFHASEPVGHAYAGKQGQALGPLYTFMRDHPDVRVIAAHWGGGLPFYGLMPEVKAALSNCYVDSAATTLLYDNTVFRVVADLIGAEHILFGSDYPLLAQARQRRNVELAPLNESEKAAILGENAVRMLSLEKLT